MSSSPLSAGQLAGHSLAILDDYTSSAQSYADWSALANLSTTVFTSRIPSTSLVSTLRPFSIILAMRERTPFPRSVLSQLPNLKFVCTTGMRNRGIDLAAARELGVVVSGTGRAPNAAGGLSTGTVEQTWALILALARRIKEENDSMRDGGWQTGVATGLAGKTLGVIGVGNLGTAVAQVGRAFGMKTLGWSPNLTAKRAEKAGVAFAGSLEELLRTSDVVTVHMVLSESTRGLLGKEELKLLKATAILVNSSRGPIVDEAALLDMLRHRVIRGAGLDVYDEEPLPGDHPLRTLDNVVLSPHMGYVEDTTFSSWYPQCVENTCAFLAGEPIRVLS